jgi:hypothetical protein
MTMHRGNRLTEGLAACWQRLFSGLVPAAALGAGLVMAFFPTLAAGFAKVQTDLGDTRLNAYLLEHGWLWLTGEPTVRLWHPAFYYPAPDALAFSDLMLSFGPLFWPWRALGCDVMLSLQLWMISAATCNFLVCYGFLRRRAAFDRLGSALGSFVISFAASRIAQLGHQQMLPIFFVIGALWAVWSLVASAAVPGAERSRRWAVAALFGCLVAQLYGGYYNFVFALAILVVAGVAALAAASSRRVLADLVRSDWRAIVAASCGAALLALPAVSHYLEAAAMAGARRPRAALDMLPRLVSYLFVSGRSWWYGWMSDLPPIHELPVRPEHAVGLGLITTGCLLWVGWKTRSRPAVRFATTIVLALGLLVTMFPAGIHLWRFTYHAFPPLQGIRAVCRIGMLLAIPAGIAIGWMVSHRAGGTRGRVVITVALLACLEQGVTTHSVAVDVAEARVQAIVERVDPAAEAFLVLPKGAAGPWVWHQLDAMWAQQRTGVPTVNGFSGTRPPGWDFEDFRLLRGGDLHEGLRRLDAWAALTGIDAERVQIVRVKSNLNMPDREGGASSAPPSEASVRAPQSPAPAEAVGPRVAP